MFENVQSFPLFCIQTEIKKKFMRLMYKFCVNDKTVVKTEISYMSKRIEEIFFRILLKYWAEKYMKMGDVYWSFREWCYHSIIQRMEKIMEIQDNIGIKLFVLAALKDH
jgi:hypothetical protein